MKVRIGFNIKENSRVNYEETIKNIFKGQSFKVTRMVHVATDSHVFDQMIFFDVMFKISRREYTTMDLTNFQTAMRNIERKLQCSYFNLFI